jgi:hypothetical protein
MVGPSGVVLYQREGSKTKYLGRRPLEEVKRLLAQAGAEAIQRIKTDLETIKQAVESQKPTQTSQPSQQPSLTWKKDGHTYWLLLYAKSFYIYMKGPSTRHKPRLVEKTDVSGVVGRVVAAGALHVLEALRLLINGLYAAVADLLRPRSAAEAREASKPQAPPSMPQAPAAEARREAPRKAEEVQVSRREAEAALKELKHWLRREIERWREKYSHRIEKEGLYDVDPDWVREDFAEFLRENRHLLEKILPYKDLVDKFVDAAVDAVQGYLARREVLEFLEEL